MAARGFRRRAVDAVVKNLAAFRFCLRLSVELRVRAKCPVRLAACACAGACRHRFRETTPAVDGRANRPDDATRITLSMFSYLCLSVSVHWLSVGIWEWSRRFSLVWAPYFGVAGVWSIVGTRGTSSVFRNAMRLLLALTLLVGVLADPDVGHVDATGTAELDPSLQVDRGGYLLFCLCMVGRPHAVCVTVEH